MALKPAHPPVSDFLVALPARVRQEGVLASRIELSTLKRKSIIKNLDVSGLSTKYLINKLLVFLKNLKIFS